MNVNIWGLDKNSSMENNRKNKCHVGYIPNDYVNYGFKIEANLVRNIRNSNGRIETRQISIDRVNTINITNDLTLLNIYITCPFPIHVWKIFFKFIKNAPILYLFKIRALLTNKIRFTDLTDEITLLTRDSTGFINIDVDSSRAYNYFNLTFLKPSENRISATAFDDTALVTLSNFQLYVLND